MGILAHEFRTVPDQRIFISITVFLQRPQFDLYTMWLLALDIENLFLVPKILFLIFW